MRRETERARAMRERGSEGERERERARASARTTARRQIATLTEKKSEDRLKQSWRRGVAAKRSIKEAAPLRCIKEADR